MRTMVRVACLLAATEHRPIVQRGDDEGGARTMGINRRAMVLFLALGQYCERQVFHAWHSSFCYFCYFCYFCRSADNDIRREQQSAQAG